jgi:hypothetical protein
MFSYVRNQQQRNFGSRIKLERRGGNGMRSGKGALTESTRFVEPAGLPECRQRPNFDLT